ncbi:MAG: CoA-binding protein, partial [Spirochaetales bacterium]
MKAVIGDFIKDKYVALVGASKSSHKFGNALLRMLTKKGYIVYPVNPKEQEIEGLTCYASVKDLPPDVKGVIYCVPSTVTDSVIGELSDTGIRRVWMHQGEGGKGAYSAAAHEFCKQNGISVVYGFCPMMFFPPVGIHKLHFLFKKWGKKLPAEYTA